MVRLELLPLLSQFYTKRSIKISNSVAVEAESILMILK